MVYPRVSLYAMMLAAAGIPLYIHLPRFAALNLGLDLAVIGTVLLLIRVVDLVQDPLFGWAIDRWPLRQSAFALVAAGGLAFGFPMLFSLHPGPYLVPALIALLVLLFSAYSLGMILLYGRSATLARSVTPDELMTVATYREIGMLFGVVLAAVAPAVFAGLGMAGQGYPAFGWFLGAIAVVSAWGTRQIWRRKPILGRRISLGGLAGAGALRLLIVALINSLPVAMTSTLFLFFVEDRLQLAGKAGLLLVLFFASAGISVPLWARLSRRISPRNVLLLAMPLSIVGFIGAGFLAPGQLFAFAAICVVSGAALGADMVVLPAMFSVALTRAGVNAGAAFGLWSFAGKLGLALAAFIVLPVLGRSGFTPGGSNSDNALMTLNVAYAFVPCVLKLAALGFVLRLPTKE